MLFYLDTFNEVDGLTRPVQGKNAIFCIGYNKLPLMSAFESDIKNHPNQSFGFIKFDNPTSSTKRTGKDSYYIECQMLNDQVQKTDFRTQLLIRQTQVKSKRSIILFIIKPIMITSLRGRKLFETVSYFVNNFNMDLDSLHWFIKPIVMGCSEQKQQDDFKQNVNEFITII